MARTPGVYPSRFLIKKHLDRRKNLDYIDLSNNY